MRVLLYTKSRIIKIEVDVFKKRLRFNPFTRATHGYNMIMPWPYYYCGNGRSYILVIYRYEL